MQPARGQNVIRKAARSILCKYNKSMRTYSVSEFTDAVERAVTDAFPLPVRIDGEISNFRPAASGHWYFILKDENAQLRAVMFKGANSVVPQPPRDGDFVTVSGDVKLYKQRGEYQIVCTMMMPRGLGSILARIEAVKQKCAAEGLFDAERKKPLPLLPSRIALITSRNAAAFEDIKKTFYNRALPAHVLLFHCAVQGDAAAAEIAAQIQRANSLRPAPDVILLSRGGGSAEDLLPFSDERVVRAVANSRVPVVSGVGHEIDAPLCELAADVRAHTPTDAAQILCARFEETAATVQSLREELIESSANLIEEKRYLVRQFAPQSLVKSFFDKTRSLRQTLDHYAQHMLSRSESACKHALLRVQSMRDFFAASSPSAVLGRGYALIYTDAGSGAGGHLVTSAKSLSEGDRVVLKLKDGVKGATIQERDER